MAFFKTLEELQGAPENQYDKGQYWEAPQEEAQPNRFFKPTFTTRDSNYYAHNDIQNTTENLANAGLDVPAPDVSKEPERAWYEKYIFDPISSLQYGLARGTQNLVDDNPNTGFFGGAVEGVKAGFGVESADKRTSWVDVLRTLTESEQGKPIANMLFSETTLNDPALKEGAIKSMGVLGDVFLDPMNLINGLGKSVSLLAKGSKALEGMQDVGKAQNVLNLLGKTDDIESAAYLAKKTDKLLGKMPDYKGITLGTDKHNLTLVPAKAIAKTGDVLSISKIGQSKVAKDIGKVTDDITGLFRFGKNADLIRAAKENPDNAMAYIAAKDTFRQALNRYMMKNTELNDTVKSIQTLAGNKEGEDLITKALEQNDITNKVPVEKSMTYDSPVLNGKRLNIQKKVLPSIDKKINALQGEYDALKASGADSVTLAKKNIELASYKQYMNNINNLPEIETMQYFEHLKNSGINPDDFDSESLITDPMEVASSSLDDLKEAVSLQYVNLADEEATKTAVMMKKAAEDTINQIKKNYPELKDYYAGSQKINASELVSKKARPIAFEDWKKNNRLDYEFSKSDLMKSRKQLDEDFSSLKQSVESAKETEKGNINRIEATKHTNMMKRLQERFEKIEVKLPPDQIAKYDAYSNEELSKELNYLASYIEEMTPVNKYDSELKRLMKETGREYDINSMSDIQKQNAIEKMKKEKFINEFPTYSNESFKPLSEKQIRYAKLTFNANNMYVPDSYIRKLDTKSLNELLESVETGGRYTPSELEDWFDDLDRKRQSFADSRQEHFGGNTKKYTSENVKNAIGDHSTIEDKLKKDKELIVDEETDNIETLKQKETELRDMRLKNMRSDKANEVHLSGSSSSDVKEVTNTDQIERLRSAVENAKMFSKTNYSKEIAKLKQTMKEAGREVTDEHIKNYVKMLEQNDAALSEADSVLNLFDSGRPVTQKAYREALANLGELNEKLTSKSGKVTTTAQNLADAWKKLHDTNIDAYNAIQAEVRKNPAKTKEQQAALLNRINGVLNTNPNINKLENSDYAPMFYYKSQKVLNDKKFTKGTSEQILQMLKGAGVKEEELKWLGINDYLSERKGQKVTKAELDDLITKNDLQLEEVEPSSNAMSMSFSTYTVKGGTNYKEFLIRQPGNDFQSPHWRESGVIGHIRTQDFTDKDGNKVLFVEELQSDLHEAGREYGYATPEKTKQNKEIYDKYSSELTALSDKEAELIEKKDKITSVLQEEETNQELIDIKTELESIWENQRNLTNKMSEIYYSKEVPDTPFKTTWHEYELKRMIRYAAENDYDKIAWATGAQQAERYGLGGIANEVQAVQKQDGTFDLFFYGKNNEMEVHRLEDIEPNKIADYIGKDLARKIVNKEGKSLGKQWMPWSDVEEEVMSYPIDKLVGAEGMSNFYDVGGKSSQNVPKFLDKYVKQWGSKVNTTDIVRNVDDIDPYTGEVLGMKTKTETITQPSIIITPEMKRSVLYEGQPMFLERNAGRGKSYLETPESTVEMAKFKTPKGQINVDVTANPEYAKDVISAKGKDLTPNLTSDLNVVKGSYGGAYAFNNEGKIVFLDNGQKPTDMSQALSHEATHSLDLNKTQVKDFNDNLKSEMTNLSDNEVIALQNIVKGITGSSIDEKMIRDGFVSKYAYGKGTQVENLTEFGSMMLHPDPSVRQAVGNMFPQSKETFYNWVSNAPRAEIDTAIRKVKPVKGELSKKIYTLKREVNGIENLLDRANAVESKISTLKEEAENLKRIIEPEHKEEFKAWFKEQYPNASTEITEVWTEFENKVVGHVSDSMTDNQRAAMDMVRKLFDEYGISEGQEMIENYVYHALNMDLRNNPVNTKLFNELHNPATPFELNRKHQGTIEKINKEMAEELGDKLNGKPFFETMISRIVAERGLKHNKFMFDKEIVDKSMSLFGTRIDKASYEGLEAEAKKAKFKEIQDMFYSGNYVVVRLDDKYREKLVNTVPSETLEGADINHAIEQIQGNNTPFILVDPKDIRPEKLFEKADQPVYLVPKDAYKSIQYQIHDQFVRSNNALLKLFDKFTNMFKAQAVFSTGFHLQNEIGNLFNSYLSIGANVLDPTLNTDAAMVQAGRAGFMDYSKEEFKKLLGEYGIVDNGFYGSEMKNFISGETDTILKSSGKTLKESLTPWNSNFMPWRANRAVGSTIENQAKLVNFMYHLKSGKSVQEAADLTHKFLFDYSDLTDFEEGFMKRIMPFYTWIRKNVPLQFEQMINSPQKYGRVYRFMNDMSSGESEEQRRFRPDYLRDATYIGDNKYANINIPYKDLGRLAPKELAGMLNPLIKVPMEVGMNKNIYFDSPIASYEGAKTKAPMYMYPIAESTSNGKFIDAKTRYIFRNMFPIAEKTSKFAEGIQDDSEKTFNNILKPINTYNVDVDSEKQRAMYRYIEKLKAAEQSGKQAGHIAKDKPQASNGRRFFKSSIEY